MVGIDDVYQKVLAIANKEQRGYITPQEFNLFADQAQMTIFDQYFYDLNQLKRRPTNEVEYSDPIEIINNKLYLFKDTTPLQDGKDLNSIHNYNGVSLFYMLSDVYYTESAAGKAPVVVEQVDHFDFIKTEGSPLTKATTSRPIYVIRNNKIYLRPSNMPDGSYHGYYIRKPKKPNWTYFISQSNALYNSDASDLQDFELHASEENNLVVKILQLAGVAMKDYNLVQAAGQEEIKQVQQEKQ